MTNNFLIAVIGAVIGAVVTGLISALITIPQLNLAKAALRAQAGQLQMPILLPALQAAGPLFLRRYIAQPPDKETLAELAEKWNTASESLVLALPGSLGRKIDDLISAYVHILYQAREGQISSEEVDKARSNTISEVNGLVDRAVHDVYGQRQLRGMHQWLFY